MQLKQQPLSLKCPGRLVTLPPYILNQLRNLHPRYKRYISFFGGHPVSITKQSYNQIFTEISQKQDGTRESPFLVCEKTDGVRYILIVCHVRPQDKISSNNQGPLLQDDSNSYETQCYFVSRQGQKNIVAYAVQLNISKKWVKKQKGQFQHIIQILDGQMIQDTIKINTKTKSVFKYLIFDILVHMGVNITDMILLYRLREINKFLQCNQFLLKNQNQNSQTVSLSIGNANIIGVELKDFFRLNCYKYNTIDFLLNKYIKCLPHENDGLIFNHQDKKYQFGTNTGYIKWKPAHLNTLDFMIVPNTNLSERFGNRVLDLYIGIQDAQVVENYIRCFYSFTIVSEKQFNEIQKQYETNQDKIYQSTMMNDNTSQNQQNTIGNHFSGAVIAQCKFEPTQIEQRDIFRKLLDVKRSPEDIRDEIMKPFDINQKKENQRILSLQKITYDKCWKIYKIRDDKGLPNNLSVAEKIEISIKDNIIESELIKRNNQLNQSCLQIQQP